ncbi:hypothetical protein B0T14DRAFT_250345 [Immersiella caudata]|uniref:Uncharacterized protein n=1 Tax=Immersiella caudata TaxID=314043 RepID=A0AA39WJP6_9PEZI|nr:hypothetical protein B0T14DRAFT_250345 [Immersiella caudata]
MSVAPPGLGLHIDGPVYYSHYTFDNQSKESHVTINHTETYCVPEYAEDYAGEVISGTLSLEGPIVPVKVATMDDPDDELEPGRVNTTFVRSHNGQVHDVTIDEKRGWTSTRGMVTFGAGNRRNDTPGARAVAQLLRSLKLSIGA